MKNLKLILECYSAFLFIFTITLIFWIILFNGGDTSNMFAFGLILSCTLMTAYAGAECTNTYRWYKWYNSDTTENYK